MRLPPFTLERFFARFEFDVPYLLGSSDCAALTAGELLALEPGAAERFGALPLRYTATAGSEELRAALAEVYPGAGHEGVVVHAAPVEAIFVVMSTLVSPGDRVVVHVPCYEPLLEVARGAGGRIERWWARPEAGWEPDLAELEELLAGARGEPARLLVINFPHNPTGFQPGRSWFEKVLRLAEAAGARVFSDEIFRFLEHDPADRLPPAAELSESAVSLGGLSKAFGLAGVRAGWIACRDPEVRRAVVGFKDYTTTCAGAAAEHLAGIAVRNREAITARHRERVVRNLDLLRAFLAERGDLFRWVEPTAGPVAFPEWLGAEGTSALAERLAREAGVLVIPGAPFAMPRHLRLGFGRERFAEGLERLGEALAA